MNSVKLNLPTRKYFKTRAAFHRIQNGKAEFLDVRFLDTRGQKIEAVDFGQKVVLTNGI